MLIVLEGCDGTGKSTLANNLSLILDAEVIHCTKETPNNMEYFAKIIREGSTRNIICDRFMYGQFVYQTEEERKAMGWLTLEGLRTLELALSMTRAKVFHVVAYPDVLKERLAARGETVINGLSILGVIDGFRDVFSESLCRVVELNTSEIDWKGRVLTNE